MSILAQTDVIMNIMEQVPALAVLAFIVYDQRKYMEKRDVVHRDIATECHDIQKKAIEVIQENSRVLGQVMCALEKINGFKH